MTRIRLLAVTTALLPPRHKTTSNTCARGPRRQVVRGTLACLLLHAVLLLSLGAHAPGSMPAGSLPVAHTELSGEPVESLPPSLAAPAAGIPAGRREPSASEIIGSGRGWVVPLRGALSVVRGFAPPTEPWGAGHRGVDLAAAPGAVVRAAGAGVVLYAGPLAGRGVVSVQHVAVRTTYEPLRPLVQRGQHVQAGQPIGVLAKPGSHCTPDACLHWGLISGETYLDPLALLRRGPVRLLPVWGVPEPPTSG